MSSWAEAIPTRAPAAARPEGSGFFGLVYAQSLIYNQCWEDPAVDRQALGLTSADRVLVITSAGCNALDYALTGARVMAVDANPRQNHLLELKLAGIEGLEFDAFFSLFGRGGSPRVRELYEEALRSRLTPMAQAFWDRNLLAFDPGRARGGSFYYSGTSGLFAHLMCRYIDHDRPLRRAVEILLGASGLEAQQRIWRDEVEPRLLGGGLLRLIGTHGVMALLGVPGPQRAMVRAHPGGFDGYIRQCLRSVMSLTLLRDNYFWLVYLTGGYTPETCPEYLRRGGFEALKAGLAGRIQLRTGTVADVLRRESAPFTAFVLLDHMDWLAQRPRLLEDEWRQLVARAAPGARVIFRSGGSDSSFLPASIRERLDFDVPRAQALHALDRVGTYGSFHLARLRQDA